MPKRRKQTKFAVLNPKAVRIPATTTRILKAGCAGSSFAAEKSRLRRFKHQAALDCGALASSGYQVLHLRHKNLKRDAALASLSILRLALFLKIQTTVRR
ncbi:MAG TPA: hypothetical protein GX398_00785 [Candidatus Cloacimonetes bacterium]|nr:hypothetical protein [Candidatus Cloacimonadota bacterium]